jgi:2-amino-4-hydroxy-6-hydroxymethyldihydropteridine diphosphokinase
MYVTAYVGLGSNLEDPVALVRSAMRALAALPMTRGLHCSSLYRSAPVGMREQPDFINAACRIETALAADDLMRRLLDIEREHRRVRGPQSGGPRTLDLDLLLYGNAVIAQPVLTVPHPRLHERAFVLAPIAELDAGLVIPGRGRVTDLLAACAGQRVERLES